MYLFRGSGGFYYGVVSSSRVRCNTHKNPITMGNTWFECYCLVCEDRDFVSSTLGPKTRTKITSGGVHSRLWRELYTMYSRGSTVVGSRSREQLCPESYYLPYETSKDKVFSY